MKCPYCGKENDDTNTCCSVCGTILRGGYHVRGSYTHNKFSITTIVFVCGAILLYSLATISYFIGLYIGDSYMLQFSGLQVFLIILSLGISIYTLVKLCKDITVDGKFSKTFKILMIFVCPLGLISVFLDDDHQ